MSATALDTSVVVAALLRWHESHERAAAAIETARARRHRIVVPATVLTQAWSVMTRLPRGHRVAPRDALRHLEAAFRERATLAPAAAGWALLADATAADVSGGGVYDLEILESARAAGADRLLTLNPDDFARFGDRGVEIVVP